MTWSQASNRGIHLGCVAVVATALTVGVGAPQPGRSLVSVQSYPVLLEAAVLSTVAPASDSPVAATVAAATDDPNAIPRTIAQIAFTAVGIAVSPLWYLGFPVTLPLTAVLMMNGMSNLGAAGWGNLAGLALAPIGWLGFPLVIGGALAQALFPPPTATVTSAAATARSAPMRSIQALRDVGSPAARKSKRAAVANPKAASAGAQRSSVGKAARRGKPA